MRCDVSTLPPQTAAVRDGDNKLPLGIRTATKLNEDNDVDRQKGTYYPGGQGNQHSEGCQRRAWNVCNISLLSGRLKWAN